MMTHLQLRQPYNGLMVSGHVLWMHNVIVYIFEFLGKEFCGTNIKVEQSMWYGKRKEEISGEANYVSIILGCYDNAGQFMLFSCV